MSPALVSAKRICDTPLPLPSLASKPSVTLAVLVDRGGREMPFIECALFDQGQSKRTRRSNTSSA